MGSSESDADDENGRDRLGGVRLYLLLRMSRWGLTVLVLAAVFAALLLASKLGLSPLRVIVRSHDGTFWLFSPFIGAIITGTSIVVTLNQLVLSQELGAVGEQRERMSESMDFQQAVEDTIDEDTSPPEPSAFLYELVDGVQARATELESAMEDARDEELRQTVSEYVDGLTDNAEHVRAGLEDAQFGTFEVIWQALQFNYSRKIYDARKIRADNEESMSDEAAEKIDHVIDTLQFFGPAREHFKTLYFQWELINLSRALLYISVPALAVMALMIMYVDSQALPGTTLGVDNLVWLTSGGFAVGIAPFIVFTVFILRIATVAKRTLAMGPFILRESQREEDLG